MSIVLIDEELLPDPYASEELGSAPMEAIADEELKGCRFLLIIQAIEAIKCNDTVGGAIKLACAFHPPPSGIRFVQARLHLKLTAPDGVKIIDLQPREGKGQPIEITINEKGTVEFGYGGFKASGGEDTTFKFTYKHPLIQGSGAGTALALWNFVEDPTIQEGLPGEQILALTLPLTGKIVGEVTLAAKVAREGIRGALLDLILSNGITRKYPVSFEVPTTLPPTNTEVFYLPGD